MKKSILITLVFFILISSFSFSKIPEFSLGVYAGSNSGISMMYRYDRQFAFSVFSGWTFLGTNGFNINANLLWLNDTAFKVNNDFMTFYCGGGIRLLGWSEIGFRIPFGLIYPFHVNNRQNRIDVFLEAAPSFYTVLNTKDFFIGTTGSVGIGARYVF